MAKEDVLCTVIPDFAFVEVFGIDYKIKLYTSFLNETICINKAFEFIFNCNKTSDIIQLFNLKEYKKNEFLTNNEKLPKKIIIIIEGQASTQEEKEKIKIMMTSGQIIGEELFYNLEQKNYIVESNHLIALESNWEAFLEKAEMHGKSIRQILNELTSIYYFNGLNINKLLEIYDNIIKISF